MEVENNTLVDLYTRIKEMRSLFRDFVESECKWSTPTFYRHLKLPHLTSAAEKEMMLKIARAQAVDLMELIHRQDEALKA